MRKFGVLLCAVILILALAGCSNADLVTWQEAYEELLLEYAERLTEDSANVFGTFLLHDINLDGTPELIVFERIIYEGAYFTATEHIVSAYSFMNGELVGIDVMEFPEAIRTGVIRTIRSAPGIVAVTHDGSGNPMVFKWIIFENGALLVSTTGTSTFNAFPIYAYDHMIKEIDGQEVTEEEFWNIFAEWSEWESLPLPLDEGNIRNSILSMQP